MKALRIGFVAAALAVALLLQTSVFPHFAWHGIVPDLVLLVVVAVGLSRGSYDGLVAGFAAGLLLDLAPPADHVAGRWALALMIVGYVAGRVRPPAVDDEGLPGVGTCLAATAACAFFGATTFVVGGLILGDTTGSFGALLQTILAAVAWDVVLAPFVLPVVMRMLVRLTPERQLA